MKSKDSQQKGTITLVAMMLVLVTVITITTIPTLSVIIPSDLKDVIVAILAAQVAYASQSFAGRYEKE